MEPSSFWKRALEAGPALLAEPAPNELVTPWRRALVAAARHRTVVCFVAGFLFDLITLGRIDSWLDLVTQGAYLSGVTALIIAQARQTSGAWEPQGRVAKFWPYNVDVLHFFYGGLLSAYIIFYTKSGTLSQSWVFIVCVAALMVANEMPQLQRGGAPLRLGLHAFCLASYLNYLLPVLLGRMGTPVFAASMVLSVLASAALIRTLAKPWDDDAPIRAARLGGPAAVVLSLVVLAYALKWIPPVPLSLKYAGIFHAVAKEGAEFRLEYAKPTWRRFWASDDGRFLAREGDRIHCFIRVFAPTRLTHQIFLHWRHRDETTGEYRTSDRIPLPIAGGRDEGYRGFAVKANWREGDWLVAIETEDGRVIGERAFAVVRDEATGARFWRSRRM